MPSAFVATYGSGAPVIGMMAELDALPGLSQEAVPYRQPRGGGRRRARLRPLRLCHGGAGRRRWPPRRRMEQLGLPGTIKCFGCPAEETLVGKVFMVRDGVFDGVDACLGHHPGQANSALMGSGNAMN